MNQKVAFETELECKKNIKNVSLNPKYKFFKQIFKTAGDNTQVRQWIIKKKLEIDKIKTINNTNINNLDNNIFINKDNLNKINKEIIRRLNLQIYKNIDDQSFLNTLRYLFYKIGTGIFVKIKSNELVMFSPFRNVNYKNNWSKFIKFNKNDKNIINYYKKKKKEYIYIRQISYRIDEWRALNCKMNNDLDKYENDTYWMEIKQLIKYICKHRKIDDVEFFINKRDVPYLKDNFTEPFNHIYNSKNYPLTSYKYDKYCPILSFSSDLDFADLIIPTADDWNLINKKYYLNQCNKTWMDQEDIELNWDKKTPTAFFRGTATGCGKTIETNPRLNISYLSKIWEENDSYNKNNPIDNIKYLDAGVTSWNISDKKYTNENLSYINPAELPFKKSSKVPMSKQTRYKYLVNIDGNGVAYRFTRELSFKSVILKVDSTKEMWYFPLLEPYVHYVPIKEDLSDLADKIEWCKKNDEKCRIISENAYNFYQKYINKNGIADYCQYLFNSISGNKSS